MKELDPGHVNKFLTDATNMKFPLGNDTFESSYLEEPQAERVMSTLGIYLSEIHSVKGRGCGLIDAERLAEGELVGSDNSWYNFLLKNSRVRFSEINNVLEKEKIEGKTTTYLTDVNRRLMVDLMERSGEVLTILKKEKKLLDTAPSSFLNGNIHLGSIAVKDGEFVGLIDFRQSLIGDPVDDLAYFSIMPEGEKYLPFTLKGWKEMVKDPDLDEKLHLYRLVESYRKIINRYVKYHYLQDYPEPLRIAQEELAYYNRR